MKFVHKKCIKFLHKFTIIQANNCYVIRNERTHTCTNNF